MKYKIIYTGATSEVVEANSEKEALDKFWEDYKELSDIEIVSVENEILSTCNL